MEAIQWFVRRKCRTSVARNDYLEAVQFPGVREPR